MWGWELNERLENHDMILHDDELIHHLMVKVVLPLQPTAEKLGCSKLTICLPTPSRQVDIHMHNAAQPSDRSL